MKKTLEFLDEVLVLLLWDLVLAMGCLIVLGLGVGIAFGLMMLAMRVIAG
jgi:hypothetical protein